MTFDPKAALAQHMAFALLKLVLTYAMYVNYNLGACIYYEKCRVYLRSITILSGSIAILAGSGMRGVIRNPLNTCSL